MDYRTCAAVESQLGGGVKFLDEELGQGYSVVRVQRFVSFLPVQHQVVVRVRVCRGNVHKEGADQDRRRQVSIRKPRKLL